jgi:hypothetical protein
MPFRFTASLTTSSYGRMARAAKCCSDARDFRDGSQAVMTACPREVCFTLASRPLAFVATPTRRATKYASQLGKLNVSAPPRASGALDVLRIHPVGAVRDRGVVKGAVQRALGDGLEREPLAVHCIDRVDGRREHVGIIYNFFGRGHQLAPHGPSPKIARLIV